MKVTRMKITTSNRPISDDGFSRAKAYLFSIHGETLRALSKVSDNRIGGGSSSEKIGV